MDRSYSQSLLSPQKVFVFLCTGIFALLLLGLPLQAQHDFYTHYSFNQADTLRGMLRPERTCYDVTFYHLNIKIDPAKRSIDGYVDLHYRAVEDFERFQIDLYQNMEIDRIEWQQNTLDFERVANAVFVQIPTQQQGTEGEVRIHYRGRPVVARRAPWDGGFVWTQDRQGYDWVGVACEGDGASLWWPNKDHLSDEPDSMAISIAVPDPLICVSNGNLRNKTALSDGFTQYNWFVSYPINNYNVTVNIGNYVHFSDEYKAEDGAILPLDYYVLPYNEQKARRHFEQVKPTLACFERFFGKYPFWDDGYALVETPYLGMEHQGAIAYGNRYMRGYLGGMIPSDMDWDYIIVHETGHEYFGNSISCNDLSEMWIHESFTTYMEALFVECKYSYQDALRYLAGQRSFIGNEEPILGPPDVNWENWKHSDHYYKGAWVLHTLRHVIGDDDLWWKLLKDFHQENKISNVTTQDFNQFLSQRAGRDFTQILDQYLWYPDIPRLKVELREKGKNLIVKLNWEAEVEGFSMPILVGKPGDWQRIEVAQQPQMITFPGFKKSDFQVATDRFLIEVDRE
jgi:aminopeptidase N